MGDLLLIIPIAVPVLFWAAYHYAKDRDLPEPASLLAVAFGLGVLAAGISQGLYVALGWVGLRFDAGALADSSTLALLAYALLVIGPIEEFAKLLPFVAVIIRFPKFDEPLDGFIYASFVALGYAAVENWQYLDYLTVTEAAARGFASPVVHIVFASVWAYPITAAKLAGQPLVGKVIGAFLVSAVLHGIYDFLVIQEPVSALPLAAGIILALWIWRLRLIRRMQQLSQTR